MQQKQEGKEIRGMMRSKSWAAAVLFVILLMVMLIVGRYTYKDYAHTIDEGVERQSTLINYQYVVEKLSGQQLNLDEEQLSTWRDRYYGVALQLPMAVLEHMTGFTMPNHDVFAIRHFYTFLICMFGWVCFYFFLQKVFRNRWLALTGMLMVALYPRFWGEQFTNIKDLGFAAMSCFSLLGISLCIENEGKWRWEFLAAFASALCANTRFVGFMFPMLMFGYRILRDWLPEGEGRREGVRWLWKRLLRYVIHLLLVLVFYVVITPASWEQPLLFLRDVFATFSNYSQWKGKVLFMGQFYPGNQLPWYYLPAWVLISSPIWYLLLMAVGVGEGAACLIRPRNGKKRMENWLLGEYRYFILCLVVAAVPLVMPILKEVTLYNSWRHVYYIFPALVVIALFGLRCVWRGLCRTKRNKVLAVLCIVVLFSGQVVWTVLNHPYEKVFFNPVGRQFADLVDRDHWYETNYRQLQVILESDPSHRICVSAEPDYADMMIINFLPPEQQNRLTWPYGWPEYVEYIIDTTDTVEPLVYEGFTPVHEVRMHDGLLLSTLYLRSDVLAERFNGEFPAYNVQ